MLKEKFSKEFVEQIKENGRFTVFDDSTGEIIAENIPFHEVGIHLGAYIDTTGIVHDLDFYKVWMDVPVEMNLETNVRVTLQGS